MDLAGVPAATLATWIVAGAFAGILFGQRKPSGFTGDVLFGALSGLATAYGAGRIGLGLSLAIPGMSAGIERGVATFLTAFLGALVLFAVLRLLRR
jgi:uncharacterized membrane protein YeaQ/YmgE (transglycosylase-associated protein family)